MEFDLLELPTQGVSSMMIIVNGENREVDQSITIARLLNELGVINKVIACALNTEIIKADCWDKTALKEGDRIELLAFVGGGNFE
ncbi:MAG: sulfur carrier protein ThiS [Helicobacteraceae bacterium]|jgi:thiamine biosynthesis protein ThiS|nr:sulfur carrier protein ThiS [Helicobacteraceae bacterium]